jgi:hypothetical protein
MDAITVPWLMAQFLTGSDPFMGLLLMLTLPGEVLPQRCH